MPQTMEGVPGPTRRLTVGEAEKLGVPEQVGAVVHEYVPVDPQHLPQEHVQYQKPIEQQVRPEQYEEAVKDLAPKIIPVPVPISERSLPETFQMELDAIKDQVNQALATVIEMVVGLEERFDTLDQRIAEFNRKGGHKL